MGTVTQLKPRAQKPDPRLSIEFDEVDLTDFWNKTAAEIYLKSRGFSVGPQEGSNPIGVYFGRANIAKWSKIDPESMNDLHGKLEAENGDWRRGAVTISIRPDAPSSVIEAFRAPIDVASVDEIDGLEGDKPELGDDEARLHVEGKPDDPTPSDLGAKP